MAVQRIKLAGTAGEREPADAKDTLLKNCYKETASGTSPEEPIVFVTKRWGLKTGGTTAVAAGRAIYVFKGAVYCWVGNTLYKDGVDATTDPGARTIGTTTGRIYVDEATDDSGTLVFHDGAKLYTYVVGTSQMIDETAATGSGEANESGNLPVPVDGIAIMDQYCFMMDSAGAIHSSPVGDVDADWQGDSVVAEMRADPGVGLARFINYIVAFGEDSIEFFYNAANATGSPLTRFDGMGHNIGCPSASATVLCEGKLVFLARAPQGGRYVAMFDSGFEVKKISTSAIDEILEKEKANISNAYAFHVRRGGKNLYVLTLPTTAGRTFVADLDEQSWYEWTSDVSDTETYFTGVASADDDGTLYILDEDNGKYYDYDPETYQDQTGSNETIKVEIRTPKTDLGTMQNKFCWRTQVIGDWNATTGTISVEWSDDDYQNWSTARTQDMDTDQTWLTRCGMFKRRAWRIKHQLNFPMRLEGLEINGDTGHYAR